MLLGGCQKSEVYFETNETLYSEKHFSPKGENFDCSIAVVIIVENAT